MACGILCSQSWRAERFGARAETERLNGVLKRGGDLVTAAKRVIMRTKSEHSEPNDIPSNSTAVGNANDGYWKCSPNSAGGLSLLGEHPAGIRAIDREMKRRTHGK